jgi:carbonic anhydrase
MTIEYYVDRSAWKSFFKDNLMKKYLSIAAISILVSIAVSLFPAIVLADGIQPHWGYGGVANPTAWGKLSSDFSKCELGVEQSPIDIKGAVKGSSAPIGFNYKSSPLVVVNNGHTIQVNYAPGSSITINGEKYVLLQFHFHTPSEHQIAGKASAMEVHLVHRNAAGKIAVVGVMMNDGKENPLISKVWQAIPPSGKINALEKTMINAANLLPTNKSYYSYAGSLTTPPCSESVKWHVLKTSISLPEQQINAFEKLYQVDARPIQPIGNRKIELQESL